MADIRRQIRIRKPLHRILLQCRIPGVAVARIPAAALLILLARSRVVEARIPAAVRLMSLARRWVVRIRAVVRIQAQSAAARISPLPVTAPVRVTRLRRRMRQGNKAVDRVVAMPRQTTVSTATLRTATSTVARAAEMLQIVQMRLSMRACTASMLGRAQERSTRGISRLDVS